MNPLSNFNSRTNQVLFGLVCAMVVGILVWGAHPGLAVLTAPASAASSNSWAPSLDAPTPANSLARNSYYNLLAQGFLAGHLSLEKEAPPEYIHLANIYDPAVNQAFAKGVGDMSYYQGRFYLYFGVTPALVLFWPYLALTGDYIPDATAVALFVSLGFLIAAGLLRSIWCRYFPESGTGMLIAGILAFGVTLGALEIEWLWSEVYEVATSCGFMFTMLTLAGTWLALHSPKRQAMWLLAASLTCGLAIASRPSLLPEIMILAVPVAWAWQMRGGANSPWRFPSLLAAAIGPVFLLGLGLMVYNVQRFGNPFEFGYHYQLTSYQPDRARQFSVNYLWFNWRFYFLEPAHWMGHFPFLQAVTPWVGPPGHVGMSRSYGGLMLVNWPLAWLAVAPLIWKKAGPEQVSALHWFMGGLFLFFLTGALTLSLFFAANLRYELDFLPELMLLSVIGLFSLKQGLLLSPGRRLAQAVACLLLVGTIVLNVLGGIEGHAEADFFTANYLSNQLRSQESLPWYRAALAWEPCDPTFHYNFGNTCFNTGDRQEAIRQYQTALTEGAFPEEAITHYSLGIALLEPSRLEEAIAHFQSALIMQPDLAEKKENLTSNNNLAWLIATRPEYSQKYGSLAVTLAQGTCRQTHYQAIMPMGTLAAAYACIGRFDDAIATAQKAIELAQQQGQTALLQKNQELLALYVRHQPYFANPAHPQK